MTTTTTKEIDLTDPEADQQSDARPEADWELRAFHHGQEVTVRTIMVEVTQDEAATLAHGEVPPIALA